METWPLRQSDITGVKEIDGLIPSQYTLEQNYPNPFNPSTTIRYSIPVESKVSLKIFDMLGREVAELVNQNQASGNYEAKFDASRLASGIYFYRLETSGTSISKKMMLLK
ncbi:MAG: hypothetical protein A2068_12445 [Ignavibacteria bacterium GWB2_35_6b]|nr:MAG: hypothetical protein A2068_12445 [Ignavibacteria bacterium GWB2_35_6b]